jgi:ketosteroid isomerase-like protein
MNVAEHIIAIERAALDRWVRADPDGYLDLYSDDATYFDPFRDKRVDGLNSVSAQLAPVRGVKLPFTEPRYDMLNPMVNVDGNTAILTYNLVNYGQPTGKTEEVVLARWNSTQVYRRVNDAWRLVHTHWSLTQPQVVPPPI